MKIKIASVSPYTVIVEAEGFLLSYKTTILLSESCRIGWCELHLTGKIDIRDQRNSNPSVPQNILTEAKRRAWEGVNRERRRANTS